MELIAEILVEGAFIGIAAGLGWLLLMIRYRKHSIVSRVVHRVYGGSYSNVVIVLSLRLFAALMVVVLLGLLASMLYDVVKNGIN